MENLTSRGEIQLTDALEEVRQNSGMMGFVVNGKLYDLGLPEMYGETLIILDVKT